MDHFPKNRGYDIIGDVHGNATALKGLLRKLGYRSDHRHPQGRHAIFIGDLINRGSEIRKSLQIARAMQEAGSATVLMGNHELNAICFHTSNGKGGFLRKHTEENILQQESTFREFFGRFREWGDHLEWFLSLPLFLDLGGLRLVHACWDTRAMRTLGGKNRLTVKMLQSWVAGDNVTRQAVLTLLKGPEVELPKGVTYDDDLGVEHDDIRVQWWGHPEFLTYRAAALGVKALLPDKRIPPKKLKVICGYGVEEPPVIFGHYGYPKPAKPFAPNVCCIDLALGRGGCLAAYRWNGEKTLSASSIVTYR